LPFTASVYASAGCLPDSIDRAAHKMFYADEGAFTDEVSPPMSKMLAAATRILNTASAAFLRKMTT